MSANEAFELREHLGSGNFAHTYRALIVDEDLAEDFGTEEVALKIPLNRKKERVLRRELETNIFLWVRLRSVDSTHLVRYLGFADFRQQIVMAMEYVPGGNLRKMLGTSTRPKRLPVETAVRIAMGVARGLQTIHSEQVFHRDIKPENILMADETPKISDLGIARMLKSNELASTTTGTIYYMSPEILCEEGASFSADLWSLGVTLYEMLTGRLPFGTFETPIGTMVDLIRREDPLPASRVCDDVPKVLSDIIQRCLQKRPADRFCSAEEMHQALARFAHGKRDEIEREIMALREDFGCSDSSLVEAKVKGLITKYPRDPRAYQYLGEFYNLCQRYAEAARTFKEGLKQAGDSALLHFDLGMVYQTQHKTEKAIEHMEKAVSMDLDPSLRQCAVALLRTLRGSV